MSRLIDADVLIAYAYTAHIPGEDYLVVDWLDIKNAPTVDAVPVVRGRWEPVTNGRGGNQCSKCSCYAPFFQNGVEFLSNFCPVCGAKMEVEG